MLDMWDGFSSATLHKRIEDGCVYAVFAEVALMNTQAIDTLVAVILRTGLYTTIYTLCLALPVDE